MGNSIAITQKIKNRMPYDPEISLLVIYLEKLKGVSKRHLYIHVHNSIFYKRQKVEATQVDEW